jgi:hypothetical protein
MSVSVSIERLWSVHRRRFGIVAHRNRSQPSSGTIDRMPDDYHPPMPRRNPEDIDLAAIKTDLEFLIERVERFRREQALKPLYAMIGSAGIVIAWIELFWRHWP